MRRISVAGDWMAKRASRRTSGRIGGFYTGSGLRPEGLLLAAQDWRSLRSSTSFGEVLEVDPPRRLVQTWHPVWDPQSAAETHTTLTYEIDEQPGGMCRLTEKTK